MKEYRTLDAATILPPTDPTTDHTSLAREAARLVSDALGTMALTTGIARRQAIALDCREWAYALTEAERAGQHLRAAAFVLSGLAHLPADGG